MLLRIARWPWATGCLLALGACGDFTLVEPPRQEPWLAISIRASGVEPTHYDLVALFSRGQNAGGGPMEVVDNALSVEGTRVLPEEDSPPGAWSYRWEWTRTAAEDPNGLVRITLPVIPLLSMSSQSVTVPVTRRAGPADVELPRGSDLVLGLALSNRVTTNLVGSVEFWSLEIKEDCAVPDSGPRLPRFTMQGTSSHPAELRVSWPVLEQILSSPMSACFSASSFYEVAGSPYPANVSVRVQLAWRINVTE